MATGLRPLLDCILSSASASCYAVVNGEPVKLRDQRYSYADGVFRAFGILDLNAGDIVTEVVCSADGVDVFSFDYMYYASAPVRLHILVSVSVVDGGVKPSRVAVLDQCARMIDCYTYEVDATRGRCRAFLISLPYGGRVTTDCPGMYINGVAVDGSVSLQPGAYIAEFTGPKYGDTVLTYRCRVAVGSINIHVNLLYLGWA